MKEQTRLNFFVVVKNDSKWYGLQLGAFRMSLRIIIYREGRHPTNRKCIHVNHLMIFNQGMQVLTSYRYILFRVCMHI